MTEPPPPFIEAHGLTKSYGAKRALNGVDLAFQTGGVVALLGPNGAGKTTFIDCALGLAQPSSGRLRLFGMKPGELATRRRIGAMLQDADLPDTLTPREHLSLFASYYPDPSPVDDVIALCELGDFATKRYGKLSGGQKRRVQFALAVVGRPDIVFLDEPTTGLDAQARQGVWRTVRSFSEAGTLVILTTHYLEEADALADRIVLLDQGHVIADASAADIRNRIGGALIRCETKLDDGALRDMPAVISVARSGRFADILTEDAPYTLRALLVSDETLSDLTVAKPSLEDAFAALTGAAQPDGAR